MSIKTIIGPSVCGLWLVACGGAANPAAVSGGAGVAPEEAVSATSELRYDAPGEDEFGVHRGDAWSFDLSGAAAADPAFDDSRYSQQVQSVARVLRSCPYPIAEESDAVSTLGEFGQRVMELQAFVGSHDTAAIMQLVNQLPPEQLERAALRAANTERLVVGLEEDGNQADFVVDRDVIVDAVRVLPGMDAEVTPREPGVNHVGLLVTRFLRPFSGDLAASEGQARRARLPDEHPEAREAGALGFCPIAQYHFYMAVHAANDVEAENVVFEWLGVPETVGHLPLLSPGGGGVEGDADSELLDLSLLRNGSVEGPLDTPLSVHQVRTLGILQVGETREELEPIVRRMGRYGPVRVSWLGCESASESTSGNSMSGWAAYHEFTSFADAQSFAGEHEDDGYRFVRLPFNSMREPCGD